MNTIIFKNSLDPSTQELVRNLADDTAQYDKIPGISEQPLTRLSALNFQHITIWKNREMAAYAHITPPHAEHPARVELIVKPEYRQEGIATTIIEAITAYYPTAQFWAYGNLSAAQACAQKFSAQPERTLLQLRTTLSEMTPSSTPEFHIRTYQGANDNLDILRINNAAFSWHPEQGNWSQCDLDNRLKASWFDPAGLFLAEMHDNLVGFHWTKLHTEHTQPNQSIGEIYILAVDPVHTGLGIGSSLTQAGLAYFRELGISQAELWVESNNTAALKVYERQGFQRYRINIAYSLPKG